MVGQRPQDDEVKSALLQFDVIVFPWHVSEDGTLLTWLSIGAVYCEWNARQCSPIGSLYARLGDQFQPTRTIGLHIYV
jgi:hypothetical protein